MNTLLVILNYTFYRSYNQQNHDFVYSDQLLIWKRGAFELIGMEI